MAADLVEAVRAAVESLGPFSILVLSALDNFGLPKSGELTVLVAASAADHPLAAVAALAAAGALIGDSASYWIGRGGGPPLLDVLMEPQRRERLERLVATRARLIVLGGRVLPLVRPEVQLLVGAARLPYRRFLVWDAAGCVTWAVLWCSAGRLLGRQVDLVEVLKTADGYVLGIVVGVVVAIALGSAIRVLVRVRRRAAG